MRIFQVFFGVFVSSSAIGLWHYLHISGVIAGAIACIGLLLSICAFPSESE